MCGESNLACHVRSTITMELNCITMRCLYVIFVVFILVGAQSGADGSVQCPVHYKRHEIQDVAAGRAVPYLLGGIYQNRECKNCKRGSLWSAWCGFKQTTVPFWDQQLCRAPTTQAIIDEAVKTGDKQLLTMTPCDLWQLLHGRTTWIMGDSMSKDLLKALRCFLVEFFDGKQYHASSNFTIMHHLDALPRHGEPRCIHLPGDTRICQVHAITGDLLVNSTKVPGGGVLPLLHSFSDPQDVFIMNFGLWHGSHAPFAKNLAALAEYWRTTKERFPYQFWMQTPKQHFDSADGDFQLAWLKRKQGPWECKPLANVTRDPVTGALLAAPGDETAAYVAAGTWRNIMPNEELGGAGMPMVPIYNVTVPAWDKHRDNSNGAECSHFCHPGLPQQWVALLHQALVRQGVVPLPPGYKRHWVGPVPCQVARERDETLVTAAAAAAADSKRPKPSRIRRLLSALQQHTNSGSSSTVRLKSSGRLTDSSSSSSSSSSAWQQMLALWQQHRRGGL